MNVYIYMNTCIYIFSAVLQALKYSLLQLVCACDYEDDHGDHGDVPTNNNNNNVRNFENL